MSPTLVCNILTTALIKSSISAHSSALNDMCVYIYINGIDNDLPNADATLSVRFMCLLLSHTGGFKMLIDL